MGHYTFTRGRLDFGLTLAPVTASVSSAWAPAATSGAETWPVGCASPTLPMADPVRAARERVPLHAAALFALEAASTRRLQTCTLAPAWPRSHVSAAFVPQVSPLSLQRGVALQGYAT